MKPDERIVEGAAIAEMIEFHVISPPMFDIQASSSGFWTSMICEIRETGRILLESNKSKLCDRTGKLYINEERNLDSWTCDLEMMKSLEHYVVTISLPEDKFQGISRIALSGRDPISLHLRFEMTWAEWYPYDTDNYWDDVTYPKVVGSEFGIEWSHGPRA